MLRVELKRKKPMQRTAFKAKAAFKAPAKLPEEPQPPKMRTRKCAIKACRKPFPPRSMTHKCCSEDCAAEHAKLEREKKDRQDRQKGLQALKTKRDYIKEAQVAFNAWVKARDASLPCVSCGRHHTGQYHAGHFLSVGAHPELRFEPLNVWKQCAPCNTYLSGNLLLFRRELINRIGQEMVDWLEGPHHARKYSIDELKNIAKEYKIKRKLLLEKQDGRMA